MAAQKIAASGLSLAEIRAEARGLSASTKPQQAAPRHLVPRAASSGPSARPSLSASASASVDGDEEFLFGISD